MAMQQLLYVCVISFMSDHLNCATFIHWIAEYFGQLIYDVSQRVCVLVEI